MLTSGAAVKRPHNAFTEQNIYFQAALYRKTYVGMRMRDAAARIDRGSEESRSTRLSGDWTSASVGPTTDIRATNTHGCRFIFILKTIAGWGWGLACSEGCVTARVHETENKRHRSRNVVLCGFRGQVIMQAATFRNSCFCSKLNLPNNK